MGGQACILYGAAEFSRDADLAIAADEANLESLLSAMAQLEASVIAVPPFDIQYLNRGHAVHFRCAHPEAKGVRVDVMSKMRGVDPFATLWERRTTITVGDDVLEVMSLPDLLTAKKTQRDKDWPMIRRLVDTSYFANASAPTPELLEFWLRESRSPNILTTLTSQYPELAVNISLQRDAVRIALSGTNEQAIAQALFEEEQAERLKDKLYWEPLLRELSYLRHSKS
jgi:hypothetical protein